MQETLFKVRDKRNKGWFWIENEYFNGFGKILGATAIAVYVCLCRHADNEQKCFPSQKMIAEEIKTTERTIRRIMKQFVEYRIIEITKERKENGKWLNNVYWLLDKSEWVYPNGFQSQRTPETYGEGGSQRTLKTKPEDIKDRARGHQSTSNKTHSNNTHSNKTNIVFKDTTASSGNSDINYLISFFKERFNLSILDGTVAENRRYCWLALKKFKLEGVEMIIDLASSDEFWQNKITSFKSLYYKGVQIASKAKEIPNLIKI